MHTALVSRLLKDRSAWELARVPIAAPSAEVTENMHPVAVTHPAFQGA
jgi:hypothetical protein